MEIFTYTETIVMEGLGLGWGVYRVAPFRKQKQKTKTVSSHFLIVEGLALCSLYTKFL